MGTETVSFGFQRCEVGYLVVKLNNPQMGTETAHPQYEFQSRHHQLN